MQNGPFVFDSTTWLVIVRQLPEEAASESQNRINYCPRLLAGSELQATMEAFTQRQIGYWLSTLNSQLSTRSSLRELFVNDLDLLIEYSAGEAIDRHVQPSNAAPFHDEGVLKTRSIGL